MSVGGGGGGSGVDKEHNAKMAALAERSMDMSEEYHDLWRRSYRPLEEAQMRANMAMIPDEVNHHQAQLRYGTAQADAQRGLLPQQTGLASAQIDSQLSLLPQQTELAKAQMDYGMTQANAGQQKTMMGLGATQSLYSDVMAGPDLKGASDLAGSQMAAGFQGAAQKTAADASRMGMGNMMSGLGGSNVGMGASVAAAKNQARRDEKNTHNQKLGMMAGLGG
ncbi:hypothetical protein OOT00_01870 [Desulfobotulus sp. H1]|uniref:Uncharacterized protein n=1 Tax=Desulfobotulus pelophilus TaxID=2823377 RepID=A0ABT3N6F0_9BACT|nr:hypothetical protein [Desulfobotulus pelophilus]MCW7752731.1 hypothetical protein [Desulfobotulus pelophilus]